MAQETFQFFSLIEKMSAREVYGKKLAEIGKTNDRIVVLTADLMRSNKTGDFMKAHPDRFFNIGIAEQNMMGIATGLALDGKLPFVSTMATFATMRACEQVRTDICYANLPVRIVATHGGLTTGAGPTHYGQEDMAIMRSLPNMTVIAPGDPNQIGKVVEASIEWEGPMYIRIGRGGEPVVYKEDYTYEIGKSITVREGDHITLIATGSIVFYAVAAAEMLAAEGIRARVIDMHTIKPLDRQAVIKAAKETGAIVTAEDHNIYGGLGSAVAEVLAEEGLACKFRRLGIPDLFAGYGEPEYLYHLYGYDAEGICSAAKALL
ncbi:MAG: transketolase C-terminal domain-containing protein [Bacillota bacterium]|jgi:transketolase|nr:transketolase C-terminal domain-containing protein [Bacillota bacterium]HHU30521.1 transketolase family protein [Bacillota bacterium]